MQLYERENHEPHSKEVILKLEGVSRAFGGLLAVSSVDLQVSRGEIVALIGPNGAGKTTLVNIITGFLALDSGKVLFEDKLISKLNVYRRNALGIARTFQTPQPFLGITALENVMIAGMSILPSVKSSREEATKWLEFIGLGKKSLYLASELTLADQKKLDLARCLATRPKLLLVDELMTGLTPTESQETMQILKLVRDKNVTIMFIEHKMDVVVRLAERIIVLDFGRKIAEGTPEVVMNNKEVIKAYTGKHYESSS